MFAFKVVCFVYCHMCVSGSVLMYDYIINIYITFRLCQSCILGRNWLRPQRYPPRRWR